MKTRPYLRLLFVVLAIFGAASTARAGEAVFSQNGLTVFLPGQSGLRYIDLSRPTRLGATTTSTLFGGEAVRALARDRAGNIVCMSPRHIVSYDPQRRTFARVHDAATSESFEDLACNPKDSLLLVVLGSKPVAESGLADIRPFKAIAFKPGLDQPVEVASRNTGQIVAPVFDAYGNLFFSWCGDLWEGSLSVGGAAAAADEADEATTRPLARHGWLQGDRIAPVARLGTQSSAFWNMGVAQIAVGETRLYLGMRAIGRDFAYLLTIGRPNAAVAHPVEGMAQNDYRDFIAMLGTIDQLAAEPAALCASADGRRVFYRSGGAYYVIERDGAQRKLPLKGI